MAVRHAREARGWSQLALANMLRREFDLNVGGQSGVARIEAGERPTRLNEVSIIANYLGIDLQGILAGPIGSLNEVEELERALSEADMQRMEIEEQVQAATAAVGAAKATLEMAEQRLNDLHRRQGEIHAVRNQLMHSYYQAADARKRLGMLRDENGER